MRKLISEILDSENVIEKCCELEILNRNWKLLLFDSGVDNLVLYEFNKKFGKYEICGMGDYNHCFIINRDMLIKQENVPLAFQLVSILIQMYLVILVVCFLKTDKIMIW